jgi:hypothetical protein
MTENVRWYAQDDMPGHPERSRGTAEIVILEVIDPVTSAAE